MKTVAVISEYNPFHLGHAYQFNEIRRTFGEDTAIVAIMSGSFVQRGDVAAFGKFDRAEAAVRAGASLVLELPFPFSCASAEHFALAGVSLANDLGVIDALSFGSECGDVSLLSDLAEKMNDPAFLRFFREALRDKAKKDVGYARVLEESLLTFYGQAPQVKTDLPNNILAISYISAIKRLRSSILPHTVLRNGTDEDGPETARFAGATHLRALLAKEPEAILPHVPESTHPTVLRALECGTAPADIERLAGALLGYFRLADGKTLASFAECGGGVAGLLKKTAHSATSFSEWVAASVSKKYTASRIRRAILSSYFGVTPDALKSKPLYTQVLAMDERGKAVLAHIRKQTKISVLTKPADLHKLSPEARKQAECSYRADSVYALSTPKPQGADAFLRVCPYRKECR